jgi:hypothetical protein
VEKNNVSAFERQFAGLPLARIGKTSQAPFLRVCDGESLLASVSLEELRRAYLRESAEILGQAEPSLAIVREANREGR